LQGLKFVEGHGPGPGHRVEYSGEQGLCFFLCSDSDSDSGYSS
jgi:hypothetical protein